MLVLPEAMKSKMLLRVLPWGKTGPSRGGGSEGIGEKLVWSLLPGDDATDVAGEDRYDGDDMLA